MDKHFYLKSGLYVSQQTIDRFNRLTRLLTENGLFKFLGSFKEFSIRVQGGANADDKEEQLEFQPITVSEFDYVLTMMFILSMSVCVIFLVEIIWFHISFYIFHRSLASI